MYPFAQTRLVKYVSTVAAAALLLSACAGADPSTGTASTDDSAPATEPAAGLDDTAADPILVGSILDATGPLNVLGKPNIDATNLAVKQINESGGLLGRPLELISFDSQSDNAKYTQYANTLALEHDVAVLMGGITSASREAIRPIVGRSETLYFYNQLYEGGVCDRNVFATGPVPSLQLAPLIPYAIENFGPRLYIVGADYNFGHISAGWVEK
jgi:urea transport system substrate-binding protein